MAVNRTRGRAEVFRQTQARRGAREARAIAGILTPAPHFLAVNLCVHRVSVVHRSGIFYHRDAMNTEKRRPGFTAHFAAFAASRAARKSASAQRRVDGPCRASVPPVEAVTMQLAERRRLGGSQRGSPRGQFSPPLLVRHSASILNRGRGARQCRLDDVSRRDGGGPTGSLRRTPGLHAFTKGFSRE